MGKTHSALIVFCMLGACAPQESPQAQHQRALANAQTTTPSDEHIATLYRQSCKLCHAIENSGAPLVQDRSQWDGRWSKGMPTLLQNVVAGFNGMPAGGQCFSCTAADYESLIKFLSGRERE